MSALPVELREEALAELQEALLWYAAEDPRVADSFAEEVSRAVQVIRDAPERWPRYVRDARRFVLRRFPFSIVYRVTDVSVTVVAVSHHRRRPSYWLVRMKSG